MTLSEQIIRIEEQVKGLLGHCNDFVTKIEFNSRINPLEKIVYGLIGMILIAFMGVIINLVIKK